MSEQTAAASREFHLPPPPRSGHLTLLDALRWSIEEEKERNDEE